MKKEKPRAWCQRGADGRCSQCGTVVPPGWIQPCAALNANRPIFVRESRDSFSCTHRGSRIEGAAGRVKVRCGNGRSRFEPVYECAIHGRCLPTWGGQWTDDQAIEAMLFSRCLGCADRAAPLATAPAAPRC